MNNIIMLGPVIILIYHRMPNLEIQYKIPTLTKFSEISFVFITEKKKKKNVQFKTFE